MHKFKSVKYESFCCACIDEDMYGTAEHLNHSGHKAHSFFVSAWKSILLEDCFDLLLSQLPPGPPPLCTPSSLIGVQSSSRGSNLCGGHGRVLFIGRYIYAHLLLLVSGGLCWPEYICHTHSGSIRFKHSTRHMSARVPSVLHVLVLRYCSSTSRLCAARIMNE